MTKNKIILIITSILILGAIFLYPGDQDYLEEQSANKIWSKINNTVNEIVKKGDQIKYKNKHLNTKWVNYTNRFAHHVELLNILNSPKMRNSYILETNFSDTNVTFIFIEENTKHIIETKEIPISNIKTYSLIPVLLVLLLSFLTSKVILSLSIGIFLGTLISSSLTISLYKIFLEYIPMLIKSNYIYIILYAFLISILAKIATYSGVLSEVIKIKNRFIRFLFLLAFNTHPYLGISKVSNQLKNNFLKHFFALSISSVLIFSPYLIVILLLANLSLSELGFNIGLRDLFLATLPYRFLTISMILTLIFYRIFNKNANPNENKEEIKKDLKKAKYGPYIMVICVLFSFLLISLITGIIKLDYNNTLSIRNLVEYSYIQRSFSKIHFINYLNSINLNLSLFLTTVVSILILVIYTKYTSRLNIKEVTKISINAVFNSFSTVFFLILLFLFIIVLDDLGTISYLISIFKFSIKENMLPSLIFIISSITSIFLGSNLISYTILFPLLIPIAYQTNNTNIIIISVAAIIEGGILGELICPYSITNILLVKNTVKHVVKQIKYVVMCAGTALITGFMLNAVLETYIFSIIAILIFILVSFLSKKLIKKKYFLD
jgi:Na+/H+ antiporter NhaC